MKKEYMKKEGFNMQKEIIYQMFLRSASRQGNLCAAEKLLTHISRLGVTVVYLCPVVTADDDENQEFWSTRQIACNYGNPKNPYRIKDFFEIDPEYGTKDDLKSFVKTAHSLGLKVILDLVYYHCGPKNKIVENDGWVKRCEDGSLNCGEWRFPRLNYDCKELCEYMWSNMEYFIREFNIDGYRCDVGDMVPLDFWREGKKRILKINPKAILINEGNNEEFIKSGVFDTNYYLSWGEDTLEQLRDGFSDKIANASMLNKRMICFENHDSVNDAKDMRLDKKHGTSLCNALLCIMFTCGCVPFIYNGNEVCDTSINAIFGNNHFCKDMYVDWASALSEDGAKRLKLITRLAKIYRTIPAVCEGDFKLILEKDGVIAYERSYHGTSLLVVANLSEKTVKTVDLPISISSNYTLLSSFGVDYSETMKLSKGGYIILYSEN